MVPVMACMKQGLPRRTAKHCGRFLKPASAVRFPVVSHVSISAVRTCRKLLCLSPVAHCSSVPQSRLAAGVSGYFKLACRVITGVTSAAAQELDNEATLSPASSGVDSIGMEAGTGRDVGGAAW